MARPWHEFFADCIRGDADTFQLTENEVILGLREVEYPDCARSLLADAVLEAIRTNNFVPAELAGDEVEELFSFLAEERGVLGEQVKIGEHGKISLVSKPVATVDEGGPTTIGE
jgi:hypothetical protein